MDAEDSGLIARDGMHTSEEHGGFLEIDTAHVNVLADHTEGQASVHPSLNFSEQDSGFVESSKTTLEIKIKTLDSSTYTVRVEKDISVPALKQQLASVVGVAAENQRLICRGRVLKDDQLLSSYNVEDGHTLHMVARHLTQSNPASVDGQGFQSPSDVTATSPQDRPAHVTHSVLVGTINVPDVGEGGVPDLNRIISAVLNSVGSGNATFGTGNIPFENIGGIGDAVGIPFIQPRSSSVQPQTSTEGQARTPAESTRHQVGLGGYHLSTEPRTARSLEVSPDSLITMSLYMNRLEQALFASGQLQSLSQTHSDERRDPTATARVPTSRESLTPAALGVLVRRVRGLLTNQAGSILSNLASNLENEQTLVDGTARATVQSAAAWSGNILQQLGSLLLELGRTTLTLHMGHSPADAVVNSGPALFISSSGPNPLMVQPAPLLPATLPLGGFSTGSTQPTASGSVQPIGPGSPWPGSGLGPRSVNIHIHTSDLGGFLSSATDGIPQTQQISSGAASVDTLRTSEQHPDAAIRVHNPDIGEHASSVRVNDPASSSNGVQAGNIEPIVQLSPLQGAVMILQENGAMRMLPMRSGATNASVRPTISTEVSSPMLFHPLGVRFQQSLSPFNISQSIRPPTAGAFQQFQSNDSAPVAVTPRADLPQSLIQLSRLSQALQPAVQSRGHIRISTPANNRDDWLSQGGAWGVEIPVPSTLSESFQMIFPSQPEENLNAENQSSHSSETAVVGQEQLSATTVIPIGEQPGVQVVDTTIVPEASRVERFSYENQSNSVLDMNMAREKECTVSNAVDSGQGGQLLEEDWSVSRRGTSVEPAQNELASLLSLSGNVNEEVIHPQKEQENKHDGKHCSKALDRSREFNERESCFVKRQKVDSASASQVVENHEQVVSNNAPEIQESWPNK